MTEWDVVGVAVVLIGLIGTFVKAAISLTKSITKNTDAVEKLSEAVSCFRQENGREHGKFETQLDDHEHRIVKLEYGKGSTK